MDNKKNGTSQKPKPNPNPIQGTKPPVMPTISRRDDSDKTVKGRG